MSVRDCRIRVVVMLTLAGLSLWDRTSGNSFAAKKVTSPSRAAGSLRNELLLSAASIFEDLTESALAGQKPKMHKALTAYDELVARVSKALPSKARHELALLVATIKKATRQSDNQSVALSSVEAYRTLIESLDTSSLRVPVQVSLMDYAGFKLKVLLRGRSPEWPALRKVAEEARQHWTAIASRVSDRGLRDAVNTTVTGMTEATKAENAGMATFASQVDLALVDLLENYWAQVPMRSCRP